MRYEYDDEFVTSFVDDTAIEKIETKSYIEIFEKYGISDSFYLEKLTKAKVYMELAKMNLEAEGMRDKYEVYKNEFDFYFRLAKNENKITTLKNISVQRA